VTHPPAVELAEERWLEVSEAFARQAPRFEGDVIYNTRELVLRRAEAAAAAPKPTLDGNQPSE